MTARTWLIREAFLALGELSGPGDADHIDYLRWVYLAPVALPGQMHTNVRLFAVEALSLAATDEHALRPRARQTLSAAAGDPKREVLQVANVLLRDVNAQDQLEAGQLLAIANRLAAEKQTDGALDLCDQIIRHYHWCQAAPEAKKLQESLKGAR
jgi:hypothetical protein